MRKIKDKKKKGIKKKLEKIGKEKKILAERGFDPRTSGLWAQHASSAPLCSLDCKREYEIYYSYV